ncbi:MAG: hypothetical protein ACJLS3_00225 [Erythrobacter sp.]
MSKRYWGVLAKFAAIAALAVATGVGAFYGSLYVIRKPHYGSVANNSGQTYPNNSPRNGLADVSGIDSIAEGIISQPQPRNSDEREQRDLAAQEAVAVFGYWMFWAVVIQTLLAGGALLAILKDLKQSRESNERALRAYLSFGPIELNVFDSYDLPGGKSFEANTTVKNGGQTPAYQCVHMGNIAAFTPREAVTQFWNKVEPARIGDPVPYVVHNGGEANAAFFSSSDISADDVQKVRDGEKTIHCFGTVIYRDTFGKERRTRFCFELVTPLPESGERPSTIKTELLWSLSRFHNDAT